MPLPKPPKHATKKQRQAIVSETMHILASEGGRPRDQMIAIALRNAGLSRNSSYSRRRRRKRS